MYRLIVGSAALLLASTAQAASCALNDATFIQGDWSAQPDENIVTESWRAVSAASWEGAGETRRRADDAVIASESLRLLSMAGEVYYLAKVAHNPRPVAFKLAQCGPGWLEFRNPQHDFPRRISYRQVGAQRMDVTVDDGVAGGFVLSFQRQSAP